MKCLRTYVSHSSKVVRCVANYCIFRGRGSDCPADRNALHCMYRYSAITLLDVLLSKFESLVCHGEHVTIDISIQQEQSVDCFANAL